MRLLAGVRVQEKLGIGDAVVKNALGLGVDVIVSSNVLKEPAGNLYREKI
ncbi:MAG: DUF1667 domain-containing protein [Treponema sp.]|jgi:CxxC motif-containing protein|nr:DUF1667 domain-containing protein [Treponema sp.]